MRSIFKYILCVFLFVTAVSALSGCAMIPVSDEELERAGLQIHEGMIGEYGEYRDAKLKSYVESVGRRVEAYSDYEGPQLTFTVLDTPIVNAFSIPGGYIHITRGLISRCNSEAELAYVIGHEIGHLTARDAAQRMSQIRTSMLLSNILGIAAAQYTKDANLGNVVAGLVDFSSVLMILSYGREAEFHADSTGLNYAYDAKYDPAAAMKFLRTLEDMEKEDGEKSSLSYLLATHPPTSDRVDKAKDVVKDIISTEAAARGLEIARPDLLRRMNGMVVGESLESGKVIDDVYYNKIYDFKLKNKTGYQIVTSRTFLAALYKEKTAVFLVYAGPASSTEALIEYAARLLKEQVGDKNFNPKFSSARVLGYSGIKLNDEGRNIRAEFFDRTSNRFAMLFNYNPSAVPAPNDLFAELEDRFYFLTSAESASIVEEKMGIHDVKAGETIDGITQKYYGDTKYSSKLLKYNGLSGALSAGMMLKIPPKDVFAEKKK